jgi:hypothetical protein
MSSKGGSGSGGNSWSTSTTVLPDWVNNASIGALQMAQGIAAKPYEAYGGQMVADVPEDTLRAYQAVRDMQGGAEGAFNQSAAAYQGLLGSAAPITTDQLNQNTSALYGNYAQNVLAPTAGLFGNYLQNASPATAEQVGQNAMTLMNPYTQSVINPSLKLSQQQLEQNLRKIGSQAANVGAFGGSRQGVEEGTATSQAILGTQSNVANLLASGYNAALSPAYNLANQASQQGYGAAGKLADLAAQGYGAAATQGGNLANTNLQAGLTAAQQLPAQALQQQAQRQKEASMLQTIGAAQQTQQQNLLNMQMGQFYEEQDYPTQNLNVLLSALGSIPYGSQTSSYGQNTTNSSKNTAGSVAGGALSGASIGTAISPGIGTAVGAVAGGILGAL